MRRTFALLITVLADFTFGLLCLAGIWVGTMWLIVKGVGILEAILLAAGGVTAIAWLAEHFLRLRRRTRWLGRWLVGLPEYDSPSTEAGSKTDQQIRARAFWTAVGATTALAAIAIWALIALAGVTAGLGIAGLILLGALWLFLNGGLNLFMEAVEDRVEEDGKLKRDGPGPQR